MRKQHCVVCAWRENCAKKFCVPDGGAHCPDFSRDIAIRDNDGTEPGSVSTLSEERGEQ
jgi:hypothetical protein